PQYDSSAAVVSLEYDVAIRAPRIARPVGVLKTVFALERLSRLLGTADAGGGAQLLVVDGAGRVIVSPSSGDLLRTLREAAAIASRVAGGDLSVTVVTQRTEAAEVGDLLSSVHTMVVALRRLVGAIRTAADEAAAMATEISSSTQEMSASTEEMTATCQDLTKRAAEQAQLVRAAADDAAKILHIATALAAGAEDSVRRNTTVADLARRHREMLDQSTAQLAKLVEEVERGSKEAAALAQ